MYNSHELHVWWLLYYINEGCLAISDCLSALREHNSIHHIVVQPIIVHLTLFWLRVKCVIMLTRGIISLSQLALSKSSTRMLGVVNQDKNIAQMTEYITEIHYTST